MSKNEEDDPVVVVVDQLNVVTSQSEATELDTRLTKFPLNRIALLIKADSETTVIVKKEAVFAIAKATELFIASLANEAVQQAKLSRRKVVNIKDVEGAVRDDPVFDFLDGIL